MSRPKPDRLISEIRRRIIAGEIPPGVNISELALAEEFGVSRTPVRESFKQLQTEGLVEIRPRVGTFVTTPSRREIVELFAANPGAGTIGHKGEMLDLPHLNRAKAVLARVGAA